MAAAAASSKNGETALPGFAEALRSLGIGDLPGASQSKADVNLPNKGGNPLGGDQLPAGFTLPIPVHAQPLLSISPKFLPIRSLGPRGAQSARSKNDDQSPIGFAIAVPVQAPPLPPIVLARQNSDSHNDGSDIADRGSAQPQAAQPAAEAVSPQSAAPAAPPEDLTFAARVQPAVAQPKPAAAEAPTSIPSAKKVIESDVKDAPAQPDTTAAAVKAVAAFESNGRLSQPPPDAPSTPSKPVEAAVPAAPAPPKPAAAQPLKDLSLEMSQPGSQKVEVRLVQQAGELHVAVRTGDSDLAHGLRQNLPELVGHLEDNGFHTDSWRPGMSAAPAAGHAVEARSASTSANSQGGDNPQSRSGAKQQDGQRPKQQSNRPAWVEQLDSSTGESYGFGN